MRTREWESLSKRTTRVSIAVTLIDSITGRMPSDPPRVRLVDRPEEVIENRSGHFVVTDLPDDAPPFTIVLEGNTRYLPEEIKIEPEKYDPPEERCVFLYPAPGYPLSPGATVVRGTVSEESGPGEELVPLKDADLTLVGTDDEDEDDDGCSDDPPTGLRAVGRTDRRGSYVLVLRGITGDNVMAEYSDDSNWDDPGEAATIPSGGPVVHVDDARPDIRVTYPDTGQEKTVAVGIVEGKATRLDVTF